eukprot:CAMPEP_0197660712 /NCGR_PEP_ID=MMETSP1338-20131121/51020_1 /TAXON_ID=43686 ORGANISM="Pelagodinium beii, Strain RCC1491" /NCGR_SAMPLE_ID=MMETSP1338 /ASSEMBLY_ACC=CAM_ASM_000754 /LENGTH=371 /DNA_ID=CAMNT_0043238129 /DNA_START=183 /DNA_END=1299 /DNA_ORIENTATION=+
MSNFEVCLLEIQVANVGVLLTTSGGNLDCNMEIPHHNAEDRLKERANCQVQAEEVAALLRRQIQTSASSLFAMGSMIEVDGGSFLESSFPEIAGTILAKYRGITNFDIAPFAVVKTKVPAEGNEGAIGHAMLSDPLRIENTMKTIRARTVLIDGPINLTQTGGVGLVGRLPVFTKFSPVNVPDILSWWPDWNHSCCDTAMPLPGYGAESLPGSVHESTYFYGLVEFVSKLPELTEDMNLASVQETLSFQFTNLVKHPTMRHAVFLHSSDVGPETDLVEPVVVSMSMPEVGIEWEMYATPRGGWSPPSTLFLLSISSVYTGLLLSIVTFYMKESLCLQIEDAKHLLAQRLGEAHEALTSKENRAANPSTGLS